MIELSEYFLKLREVANSAADHYQVAWDDLERIASPTLVDLERWLVAKRNFDSAQNAFEATVRQHLGGAPDA